MAFDTATLTKARESGYSDEEVGTFLSESDPRVQTALSSGYSLDEIAQHFDPKETPQERPLGELSSRVLASAAEGGLQAAAMGHRLMSQTASGKIIDFLTEKTIGTGSKDVIGELEGAASRAKDDYGVDPKFDKGIVSATASGAGSLLPILASGPAAPITGGLMQAEQTFQEATEKGVTGVKRATASALAGGTAAVTELALGLPKMLKIFKEGAKVPLNTIRQKIASVLKGVGKSAAFESVQEGTEQVLNDLIAKGFYDPERKWFDAGKIGTAMVAGGLVGGGFGGVMQTAFNAQQPETIAPKQEMQDVAQSVDESLAQMATEEPPPAPSEVPPVVSETQQGTPVISPEEMQAVPEGTQEQLESAVQPEPTQAFDPTVDLVPHASTQKGEHIISTGILTPEGIAYGPDWNTRHADISKLEGPGKEIILKAMDAGMDPDEVNANKGFIVQDVNGKRRFVGRKQAVEIARKSGQVDESKLFTKEELISEALIQPKGEPNAQAVRSDEGQVPVERNVPQASPSQSGQDIQQPAPAEPSGTTLPQPKVAPEEAAVELDKYFDQAVAAAKSGGATEPKLAASIARDEMLKKGITDPKQFIGTARKRGIDQARKAKQTVPIEEAPEPATEAGPRSQMVSEEDLQSLDEAVNKLPEVQRNIIRALEEDPTLTDKDVGDLLKLTVDQVKKAKMAFRKTMREFIQSQGIGARLGPGAANVEEALAQYELRKFGQRFQETEEIAPEVRKATGDRYYEPIPNQVTAQKATELIEKNGEEAIEQEIRDEKSSLSFADRATVGQILIKKLNERFKSLTDKTSTEAQAILDKASSLAEWAADFGTRLGQGVQSFAMWVRLTAEGKLRAYEKVVKARQGDYTRNNRNDIDEIKDIVNGEGSSEQKVRKIRKLKSPTAKRVRSKAGKLIQAAKDGKLTDEKFYEATAEELGLPVFNPEVSKTILDLAQKVDQAPEGMPKQEAMLELNKFLAEQKGYNPSDLLWGYYYGNILSGTGTHLVNAVDTGLNILNESITLALQNPRAMAKVLGGLARGLASGRADAWLSITKGRRISDGKFVEDPFFMEVAKFGKKGGVPLKSDTRFRRIVKSAAESKLATPLNAWKYVGRLMGASDALMFRAAQEAKAAVLANRIANEVTNADQILGYDRLSEFREQAESEGYKGLQAEARATELMLMSRPPEIQKASTDFAAEGTYNVKPYGMIGTVANSVESLSRKIPPLKLIVPFTRIVGNVLNRNINNTPFGYYRAIRGKAGSLRDPKTFRQFTPEERNTLLIRATVSTALLGAAGALHALGYIEISGGGPADPEKKKQLRATGWKPYTVRVGDHYWNYSSTPIALGMAILGNFLDNAKYNDFTSKEMTDKVAYALQAISGSLLNQSFLTNLGTFWDALSSKNPGEQFSSLKRLSANTASALGVPMSSLMKDMESFFSDPNVPKANTLKEAIMSQIPFASQGLKPQLNAFGHPIKTDRSRFETPITTDPAWKIVMDKALRVPVPNNFFDDPDKQYDYVREQGNDLEKWVLKNEGRLRNMSQEHAQDALESASDSIRQRIRNKYLRQGGKRKEKKTH